jgi:molybdopterin converting factor small subunit
MASSVRVLLFATAREAAGVSEIRQPVGVDGVEVAQLLEELISRYPRLEGVLRTARLVRNGEYLAGPGGRLRPGDEFAIHPPFSGG